MTEEETTIIDGWLMKKVGTYLVKAEAHLAALALRRKFYRVRILPEGERWNVFSTITSVKTQERMKI